jgi:hypothetical protein
MAPSEDRFVRGACPRTGRRFVKKRSHTHPRARAAEEQTTIHNKLTQKLAASSAERRGDRKTKLSTTTALRQCASA